MVWDCLPRNIVTTKEAELCIIFMKLINSTQVTDFFKKNTVYEISHKYVYSNIIDWCPLIDSRTGESLGMFTVYAYRDKSFFHYCNTCQYFEASPCSQYCSNLFRLTWNNNGYNWWILLQSIHTDNSFCAKLHSHRYIRINMPVVKGWGYFCSSISILFRLISPPVVSPSYQFCLFIPSSTAYITGWSWLPIGLTGILNEDELVNEKASILNLAYPCCLWISCLRIFCYSCVSLRRGPGISPFFLSRAFFSLCFSSISFAHPSVQYCSSIWAYCCAD